ncbi:MAG: hypothetical protein WCK89_17380, partial [bacterium]
PHTVAGSRFPVPAVLSPHHFRTVTTLAPAGYTSGCVACSLCAFPSPPTVVNFTGPSIAGSANFTPGVSQYSVYSPPSHISSHVPFTRYSCSSGLPLSVIVVGSVLGAVAFGLDYYKYLDAWDHKTGLLGNMMVSFYLFVFCCGLVIAGSRLMPEPIKEEAKPLVWEDWREPLRGESHGRWLGDYRVLSAVVVVAFVALYIVFR